MLSKTAIRAIAIRNSIKAHAEGSKAPVAQEVSKTSRPKVVKVEGYASDAGKVRFYVSKSEVAQGLGLEVKKISVVGTALAMLVGAVSQSTYAKDGDKVTRLGERLEGVEGLKSLHDDFGKGNFRGLWLTEDGIASMTGQEGFDEAFAALQVASDARQESLDRRYAGFKKAVEAKKATKTGAEAENEKVAA